MMVIALPDTIKAQKETEVTRVTSVRLLNVNANVIFILSRYINYNKHELLRLLADWTYGLQCPPKHWKAARK